MAILPHESLRDKITLLKQYIAKHYRSKAALKSPPHVTLFPPFYLETEKEGMLVEETDWFCSAHDAFPVVLKGFKAFSPRVMFVNVLAGENLSQLQRQYSIHLEEALGLVSRNKKDRPFAPHVTIAFSDLTKENFHAAWKEFKERAFSETFIASAVTILKHNGKTWDVFHSSPLRDLPTIEI